MFPIRDDNTGRIRTPYVTWALIALNVIVFVFLQGLGSTEPFTYAFSTMPQEIRTGDGYRRERHCRTGRSANRRSPSQPDADQRGRDAAHVDVHAWRPDASARQHAVPLDFWRQRRGRSRARPISGLLSHDGPCGFTVPRGVDVRVRGQPVHSQSRRLGSDLRRDGRLSRPSSASASHASSCSE